MYLQSGDRSRTHLGHFCTSTSGTALYQMQFLWLNEDGWSFFTVDAPDSLPMHLILYSKPGCHLCEGLQEKLAQVQSFPIELEVRDITTRDDWFQSYQYEIPVVYLGGSDAPPLPRFSPRATVAQLEQTLKKYLPSSTEQNKA